MRLPSIAYTVTLALLASLLPTTAATHDPNDFFALEADLGNQNWRTLHGLTGSTTAIWAVGDGIASRRSGAWQVETFPTGLCNAQPCIVTDVYVIAANDVWVSAAHSATRLGASVNQFDFVAHWDGAAFTVHALPTPDPSYLDFGVDALWAFASNDVWAFAGVGIQVATGIQHELQVYRWNGAAWSYYDTADSVLSEGSTRYLTQGVWAASATKWHAAGVCDGVVCPAWSRWNGAVGADLTRNIRIFNAESDVGNGDIWGAGTNDVWGVGEGFREIPFDGPRRGAIYRNDGTPASGEFDTSNPSQLGLRGVWGTSSTDVWIVGELGTILHRDATGWTTEPSLTSNANLNTVWASSTTNVWAAGEDGGIYRLQVNPPTTLPNLAGLAYDPDNLHVSASQAQCLGDETSLAINVNPANNGIDSYIINSDTNVVVEQIQTAGYHNLANSFYHTSRTYPAGDYAYLALADTAGILGVDSFMGVAFNVPTGACQTDLAELLTRFDQIDFDLSHVHTEVHARTTYTDNLVNTTSTATQAQVVAAHNHIDTHFIFTNLLINQTFMGAVFNLSIGQGISNQTVALLANEFGLQLGDTTTLNILIILLMVVIGVWLYGNKQRDLLLRVCGVLIVLTAGVIALTVATAWEGGTIFAALVCLFAAGLMWTGFQEFSRERKGEGGSGKKKGEFDL